MVKSDFKSIGDILDNMFFNCEEDHKHNINRLIQEFGGDKELEINSLYLSYKEKIENGKEFINYAIPLEVYERTRKRLYFSNQECIPPDCILSKDYL